MAKKKSSNLGLILKVVALLLGVASFCMAFVVAVKFVTSDGDLVNSFTGFQTMFGYSETTTVLGTEITSKYLAFSFMTFVTFLLPLVGAVLSLCKNKIVRLVGAVLMIVGAVLMFFVPSFAVLATTDGNLTLVSAVLDGCTRTLGVGAILGGVFAGLGGLVAGYNTLTNK
ncbi:MAG: hypothetical protein ACI4PF_06590 [Christensenellales bacterium]